MRADTPFAVQPPQAKLEREASVREELAELHAELERLQLGPELSIEATQADVQDQAAEQAEADEMGAAAGGDAGEQGETAAAKGEAAPDGAAADIAADVDETPYTAPLSLEEVLQRALIVALQETVKDGDLPMLTLTLSAQHIKPAVERLHDAPEGGVQFKKTKWKKLSAFLEELQAAGLLQLREEKMGVHALTAIDRSHSLMLDYHPEAWFKPEEEPEEVGEGFRVSAGARERGSHFRLPTKGSKKLQVQMRRIRNKNVTIVAGPDRFGIELDDDLRRDLAKKFSASVSTRAGVVALRPSTRLLASVPVAVADRHHPCPYLFFAGVVPHIR